MVHTSVGSRAWHKEQHAAEAQLEQLEQLEQQRRDQQQRAQKQHCVQERRQSKRAREQEERQQERAELTARADAADAAVLAERPTLPKAPPKPDLRRVKEPSTIAALVVEHLIASVEYNVAKARYNEELKPFRKAQMRQVSRADYSLTRQHQLNEQEHREAALQEAARREAALLEERSQAKARIWKVQARFERVTHECPVQTCRNHVEARVSDIARSRARADYRAFDATMLCGHQREMLENCGWPVVVEGYSLDPVDLRRCLTGGDGWALRAIGHSFPLSAEDEEHNERLITREVERARCEGVEPPTRIPSLRCLALESLEAQSERRDADVYVEKFHHRHMALGAMRGRGQPFTHSAWADLRYSQGLYFQERGLLVEAECEYKAYRDSKGRYAELEHCRGEGELAYVREARRERRYGYRQDRERWERVWRPGTAMAAHCRMAA